MIKEKAVSLDSAIHLAHAVRWLSIEERALLAARYQYDEGAWIRVEATILHHIPSELTELIEAFSGIDHPIMAEAIRLKALCKERGMEMLAYSKSGPHKPRQLQVKAIDDVLLGIELMLGKMERLAA